VSRLLAIALAACSAPPSAPVAIPVLPDVPFALLDRDQRVKFMEERVVPAMAPLFRAHDPQRYAEFGCKTCHGAGDYAMPNDELPKLVLPIERGRHDARVVEWMTAKIRPAMARLLDDESFECLRCHVRDAR
jgi:hypothetical protein